MQATSLHLCLVKQNEHYCFTFGNRWTYLGIQSNHLDKALRGDQKEECPKQLMIFDILKINKQK